MPDVVPTHVRYRVIGVCSLMSVLLYLDRFCVSFALPFITEELNLSPQDISLMIGVFFATYALGQTPSGWLADRFGGRRMLTLFILSWSLFTGLLGLASGILVLVLLRVGMGFAQAGAYPTAATMISKWVPVATRGVASSIVALGGRIGGALSLLVTGFVILFFVPTTVKSTLEEQDLLLGDRLCYELIFGTLPPTKDEGERGLPAVIGQRILRTLPTQLQASIDRESLRYRDAMRNASSTNDAQPVSDGTTFELRAELIAALNQSLSDPNLFALQELGEIKLEHEAKRLLNSKREELSPAQVERMNRLVFEALYPKAIRKVYGAGWRQMTFLYGAIGVPVAMLFWFICRDHPRQHPRCNDAELSLIEVQREPLESTTKVGRLPLRELATNRSMWFNGAMQFFTNVGWVFLLTYLPTYLVEVHQVPIADRAWMSTMPTVVAIVGMFLGGFLTDGMVARLGRRWGRSLPVALTRFAAGGAYLACVMFDLSPWWAVVLLSAASFFCDLGIPAVWAFQQDVGGKHTGSVLGWGNMWGNFGAFVGPYLIGWFAGQNQNWNAVFLICAAAFGLSGLAALGINANQKVVPEGT